MIEKVEENCKYCGREYPYPGGTRRDGKFYLVFEDKDASNSLEDAPRYITICPSCISTMVSTYQLGHEYELVGLLEDTE